MSSTEETTSDSKHFNEEEATPTSEEVAHNDGVMHAEGHLRFRGETKKGGDQEKADSGEDLDKKVKPKQASGTDVNTEDFLTLGGYKTHVLSQIIFSYLWWSVFTEMPGVLWSSSLSHMKIAGYELLSLLLLSPILMLSEPVHDFLTQPFGLLVVRLLTLTGVLSFLTGSAILHKTLISVGGSCCMMALGAGIWSKAPMDRFQYGYLHMLGYFLYLVVRVWGSSFNYIFMKSSVTLVALCAGVVVCMIMCANDYHSSHTTECCSPDTRRVTTVPISQHPMRMVATGTTFGALLFVTCYLLGDVAVICRWLSTPLPFVGPKPNPWGLATLLTLVLGLSFYGAYTEVVESVPWLVTAMASSMLLYFGTTYFAFFGGLMVSFYIASLWPLLFKYLVSYPPGQVLGVAMGTYLFYLILSVWVVAFGFLPGGSFTRERTDVLLGILIFNCGIGTCSIFRAKPVKKVDKAYYMIQTISEEQFFQEEKVVEFNWIYRVVTTLVLLFGLLGYIWREQPPYGAPIKEKEQQKIFSAGIWPVQFGYDNLGWTNVERAAQFIKDTEIDVIGLLETDAARPYIGSHDIASWLSERLHMHVDYGPGTKEHTWGVTVLSKYPILKSQHYKLPSPKGHIAPAILATVNISGELVDIYVVQFGSRRDDADRILQVQMTVDILKNCSHPVVMLGYLTTSPGCRDYSIISEVLKDIDTFDTDRFHEYIFFRNVTKLGYGRISHGGLSDTEMQIAKFYIFDPQEASEWVYTIDPANMPEWLKFPSKFGDRWTGEYADNSRHHFHMGTPKYFYA